tara:strand:- start:448 stop:711 length:264 start_codon:yes stop_codon:yes gene_type:complete
MVAFFKECVADLQIPDSWQDVSHGNDVCPSFQVNGYHIFIDHPDPKARELEMPRYGVMRVEDVGEITGETIADFEFWDDLVQFVDAK